MTNMAAPQIFMILSLLYKVEERKGTPRLIEKQEKVPGEFTLNLR